MKNSIFLIALLISFNSYSQDIVKMKDRTELKVKVIEIGPDIVKYKNIGNLDGPLYTINKNEISEIQYSNGTTEKIENRNGLSLEETKSFLVEFINKYGSDEDSDSRKYYASFEEDYLRLVILNSKGKKTNDGILFNFGTVFKFQDVSLRNNDRAYVNIYTSILKVPKKNIWDKHKLIMRVQGYQNGESILSALKHLNQLLLEKKPQNKF